MSSQQAEKTDGVRALKIEADARSIKEARDFVGAWFAERGYERPVVHVARTVATELVTNAFKHAARPGEDVVVRVYLSELGCVIEVWDHSDERPVPQPLDPERLSGRGLAMVEILAEGWGITMLASGGKAVYALLPPPP